MSEIRPSLSSLSSLGDVSLVAAVEHDNEEYRFGDRKIRESKLITKLRSHVLFGKLLLFSESISSFVCG